MNRMRMLPSSVGVYFFTPPFLLIVRSTLQKRDVFNLVFSLQGKLLCLEEIRISIMSSAQEAVRFKKASSPYVSRMLSSSQRSCHLLLDRTYRTVSTVALLALDLETVQVGGRSAKRNDAKRGKICQMDGIRLNTIIIWGSDGKRLELNVTAICCAGGKNSWKYLYILVYKT